MVSESVQRHKIAVHQLALLSNVQWAHTFTSYY